MGFIEIAIVLWILNVTSIHGLYKIKYSRQQCSVNLMGYEQDGNDNYPVVIGKKHGSIFLACEVVKMEPMKIRWLRNKKRINFPPPHTLPWRKGSVLMIQPLIYGRTDGVYECIISNSHMSLRKGVNITIRDFNGLPKGFPHITTHPGDVLSLRNNVDLHCIVTGEAPIEIVWFHNRVPLSDSSAYNVSPTTYIGNIFSSNITIMNVTKQTTGFYQCAAMNLIGYSVSNQANIQLRGENKPKRFARSIMNLECSFKKKNVLAQFSILINATCKFLRTSVAGLDIAWEPQTNHNISRYYLLISNITHTLHTYCFNGKRKRVDFEHNKHYTYNITVIGLSDVGRIIGKGEVIPKKCPLDISVQLKPSIKEIEMGKDFTFQCIISGRPKPTLYQINWYFSHSTIEGFVSIRPPFDHHVKLSDDKTEVQITDITKQHEGRYRCDVENDLYEHDDTSQLYVKAREKEENNILIPAIAGVVGGLLFIMIFVMIYLFYTKRKPYIPVNPTMENARCSVYISHCVKGKKSKKLLEFADLLQREFSIEVILDLTSNVAINKAGGMFLWLPLAMQKANKIMILLSRDYLETLKLTDKNDEMICKVHAEFAMVNNIIYHEHQRTRRLVIIADGVSSVDFPSLLNGRAHFELPHHLEKDDTDVNRIVGVLYDEEFIQLPTKQLIQSGGIECEFK